MVLLYYLFELMLHLTSCKLLSNFIKLGKIHSLFSLCKLNIYYVVVCCLLTVL